MSEPSSKICVSPIRRVSLDSLEELSPIRYTNRSETPPPKISLDSSPIRDKPSRRESFSNQSKSIFSDDEEDSFLDKLSLKPSSISRKRKASPSNINLIDLDSDGSLPSVNDFFDQLMSQKEDRKGKGRAYSPAQSRSEAMSECSSVNDEMPDLSAKEQRRLDAEERKRTQMQEKLRAAEERKQLAEEKKRKREELLEEKKLAKERKILEKERNAIFEKENRIKSNRVETIKEMIVEMHPDFVETKAGELLKMVLEKKETTIREGNRGPYHLLWKRICTSEWDEDTLAFIPYKEPKVITEPFVLVYVDIYELFKHIQADTTDDYVDHIKSATEPDHQIFLLVEGLQAYYRKKINLERRIFDEQIRSTIDGASTSASRRKIQPEIENGPSHKQVEEAVNYLILKKDIMFVMTKSDEDTVSWIESLTTDLALGRYKNKNLNSTYKSRKACSDPTENYSKILQEIQLCTQAVATSVMNEYPTLQSLHRAYTRESKVTGEQLLADLDVERSALSARDRKVNRSMSKKIYRIFSTDDPNEVVN
ncbi:uncharacterized protein EV154DRAFT_505797 [Mucor mucedo]|uniref:uncharacterized protein n=1 Tax=Mucor mucedo TaxID=29922 RepID=UPI00221FDCA3|nr:uncharacterized protein EV154DRAFT_505797 [Mucor mucedo]KAI7892156.1 hypothetical protein EV154DRAFT_505797 [Mucor mucedo]